MKVKNSVARLLTKNQGDIFCTLKCTIRIKRSRHDYKTSTRNI